MCLGLAARVVAPDDRHADLAVAEIAGVRRTVNVGLLEQPVAPGDWVLVHMGFALSPIPADEVDDVLASLGLMAREREAGSALPKDGWEPEWTR
ncbi:HypC/HybG/HupF family hydrogenase formation chaperone [Actinocrinis puniceicyclus]|uniref:HypC/HybG/HupF family hydrogenase formation chaperone n=1 Tax=Actinocrinis puniceicyclus TaxID=977794 RepID=A0A8J7WFZ7_9ACTN|nr:HypC/HybG/HupF family hydrogenase formation chaperone [Actinocrinis puniceicyclus]MBS2961486.1 HypC/HybG/HupF family hydrogenase formation chaperone [Actinocrinis puniceicyclus]